MLIDLDREYYIEEDVVFLDFKNTKDSRYQVERLAKKYYTGKGYFVLFSPSLKRLLSGKMGYSRTYRSDEFKDNYKKAMEIFSKKSELLFLIDSIFKGFPDLIVFDIKKKNFFLVETKRNDKIMHNQIIFNILIKEIFRVCDIKLIRIKPIGSCVKSKRSMKVTLRTVIDSYLVNYNKRKRYRSKRKIINDSEEIEKLEAILERLENMKDKLNESFYSKKIRKIEEKIDLIKSNNYSNEHFLNDLLVSWSMKDELILDLKYLRRVSRKILKHKIRKNEKSNTIKKNNFRLTINM